MNKILVIALLTLISCKESKTVKKELGTNEEIPTNNKEFIDYLKEYEVSDLGNPNEITFQKIGKNIFWVTHYQEGGTRQEYYLKNTNNLLVPSFVFEYGGVNWNEPLGYHFEDIDNNNVKEGTASEKDIIQLKQKFIEQSEKK